jgi:hypothetical protein
MRSPLVWAARAAWVTLVAAVAPALEQATQDRSRSVQVVVAVAAWCVWGVVIVASLVRATVSLTVWRALAPLAPVGAAAAWFAGASALAGVVALATTLLATFLAFSADVGEAFVQGSAYGDERRLPLRPPAPLLVILPTSWALVAMALGTGMLLLATEEWVPGALFAASGAALAAPLGKRLHRFSRRWLVLVPAGVVVHDQVVLGESVMTRRGDLESARLAPAGSEAADLTGVTFGPAVELRFREPATVVLADARRRSTRAIHARSVLVSPSRPGRTLRALAAAGVPVGSVSPPSPRAPE